MRQICPPVQNNEGQKGKGGKWSRLPIGQRGVQAWAEASVDGEAWAASLVPWSRHRKISVQDKWGNASSTYQGPQRLVDGAHSRRNKLNKVIWVIAHRAAPQVKLQSGDTFPPTPASSPLSVSVQTGPSCKIKGVRTLGRQSDQMMLKTSSIIISRFCESIKYCWMLSKAQNFKGVWLDKDSLTIKILSF